MWTCTSLVRVGLVACGALLIGCSDGDGDFEEARATDTTVPCDGAAAQSSIADGHTHELCVPRSDLVSPPPNGAAYETAAEDGHTHVVFIDPQELGALERGLTVEATTSTTNDHAHPLVIRRIEAGHARAGLR